MSKCCSGQVAPVWKMPELGGGVKKKLGDPCVYCDGVFQYRLKKDLRTGWKKVLACSRCLVEAPQ